MLAWEYSPRDFYEAWIEGEKEEQQPAVCVNDEDPPLSSDARGYFIPHLRKIKSSIEFSPDFWNFQQFFTRGRSSQEHAAQLVTIPKSKFQKIRRLCLDHGYMSTIRVDKEKTVNARLEDFNRILEYCFTHGHPNLIIKLVYLTLLAKPGAVDEEDMHERCWDPYLCEAGNCQYGDEPARLFLEFRDKFHRRCNWQRALLVPVVCWTKVDATQDDFHDTQAGQKRWDRNEKLHKIDATTQKYHPPILLQEGKAIMVSSLLIRDVPHNAIIEAKDSTSYITIYGDTGWVESIKEDLEDLRRNLKLVPNL